MDNLTTRLSDVSPAMPIEKYSLLRDAYAIIDGIPEERFNLNKWREGDKGMTDCGTIACAAGWLTMHPDMKSHGLTSRGPFHTPAFGGESGYGSLEQLFGIDKDESWNLFCPRNYSSKRFDPPNADKISDKQLWLARVREFLRQNT